MATPPPAKRQVQFAPTCILILEHDVIVPHQQVSTAGGILRVLNPRNLAMHLPLGWSQGHARRSSSSDGTMDTGTDESGAPNAPPKLSIRISSFAGSKKAAGISPLDTVPPRSCLKAATPTDTQPLPRIPGSYFGSNAPPSPTLTRGRSISSTSSGQTRSHASPPPQHHIPTKIIPLRECCPMCASATEDAAVSTYKISWTPGAAAKKKRDDAEERGDLLAGLKRDVCTIKWGKSLEMNEGDDDGFANPVRGDDEDDEDEDGEEDSDEVHPAICASLKNRHVLDPLSKLDGTSNISRNSSTSTLNRDWTPDKYYDAGEDEEDLFPLPSPKGTPPIPGSPATSATHLPSGQRPISPLAEDGWSRSGQQFGPGVGLGLPTIAGSLPNSPGPGSSRSSVTSAGSHGSGAHARRPSPLREESSSTVVTLDRLTAPAYHGRPQVSPPPSTSSHTQSLSSITSSGSSGAGRVWTSSFVPPPLPKRNGPLHAHKLAPAEGNKSPFTRIAGASAKSGNGIPRREADRGERAHPPPMPTYSGVQREVVIVASSKKQPSSSSRREEARSGESTIKRLPPIPGVDSPPARHSTDSTPVGSRAGSRSATINRPPAHSHSQSQSQPPPPPSRDTKWETEVDLALSRVPTVTRESASKMFPTEDDRDSLSPLTSPKKKAASSGSPSAYGGSAPNKLRRAGSGNNLRVGSGNGGWNGSASTSSASASYGGPDEFGGVPRAPPPSGGVDAPRTRSSSIRKLWNSVASGVSAAAGVHG